MTVEKIEEKKEPEDRQEEDMDIDDRLETEEKKEPDRLKEEKEIEDRPEEDKETDERLETEEKKVHTDWRKRKK